MRSEDALENLPAQRQRVKACSNGAAMFLLRLWSVWSEIYLELAGQSGPKPNCLRTASPAQQADRTDGGLNI